MKKFLILAVSAAVLLTGCQKTYQADSLMSESGQDAIGFSTYTGREVTKATTLGSGTSFNVSAYLKTTGESAYYGNQLYTWDGTSFVSDPVHYWPTSGTLDFYAVMPAKYSDGTDIAISDKTVSFTADGATDLSAVLLAGQSKPESGNTKLIFGHKLTKVAIRAKGEDSSMKYAITSVTLTADSKATYTYSSEGGYWELDGTPTNKPYTVLDESADNIELDYGTTTYTQIGNAPYLLPVQSTTANTVTLTLTYNVYVQDAETAASDCLIAEMTKSVDLTSTATGEAGKWAINQSIIYNLTLPTGASTIKFDGELTDWDEGE